MKVLLYWSYNPYYMEAAYFSYGRATDFPVAILCLAGFVVASIVAVVITFVATIVVATIAVATIVVNNVGVLQDAGNAAVQTQENQVVSLYQH